MSLHLGFDITRSQAETILSEIGLKMDEFYRRDTLRIEVPIGREKDYVDQIRRLPGVDGASLNVPGKLLILFENDRKIYIS